MNEAKSISTLSERRPLKLGGHSLWLQKDILRSKSSFDSFSWLFIYFLGFAYIYLLITTNQEGFSTGLNYVSTLSILIIALSSAMIAFSLSRGEVQIVSGLFWLFQYIFFGITGYSFSLDQYPMYMGRLVVGNGFEIASIAIFGSVMLVAIVQIKLSNKKIRYSKNFELMPIDLDEILQRIRLLNFVYLFVAPIAIYELGGLRYLFKSGSRSVGINAPNLALFGIYEALLFVTPILVFSVHFILKNVYDYRINKIWYATNFIWVLVLSNPISFARQTVLFMLLPIFFLFGKRSRKVTRNIFLFLPFMILIFANLVNRYTGKLETRFEISPASRILDLDAYPVLANGMERMNSETFPLLNQILGSMFFYIPRSIWEAKPIDTGALLGQYSGLSFYNLSAPWILEAYANARVTGLIVISILLGIVLSRIEPDLFDFKRHLQGAVIAGSAFILLRGSLLQATGRVVFSLLLIQVLCLNLSRSKPLRKVSKDV